MLGFNVWARPRRGGPRRPGGARQTARGPGSRDSARPAAIAGRPAPAEPGARWPDTTGTALPHARAVPGAGDRPVPPCAALAWWAQAMASGPGAPRALGSGVRWSERGRYQVVSLGRAASYGVPPCARAAGWAEAVPGVKPGPPRAWRSAVRRCARRTAALVTGAGRPCARRGAAPDRGHARAWIPCDPLCAWLRPMAVARHGGPACAGAPPWPGFLW